MLISGIAAPLPRARHRRELKSCLP